MKKLDISILIIFALFYLINSADEFCLKIKKLEDSFPSVDKEDTFYFKKLFGNNYIIGTQNSATLFRISNFNSDDATLAIEQHESMQNNYKAYSDAFGNINPIFGFDNMNNPTKIKYIVTEGGTVDNEYMHALYDIEHNILREGKFSDALPDFKILEALNENEYIGALRLSNSNTYSIKLQIMSFKDIYRGDIKILNAKEYASVVNEQHNINNIFYIKNLNKIMLVRTYTKNIYLDFIDYYYNSFGSVYTAENIQVDFDISEYKFNSIELKTEDDKIYIISCFRKYNFVYCLKGYFDKNQNKFIFIQKNPKLMMSSCDDARRPYLNLLKINTETIIIGCPGENYKAMRFDADFNKIGTEIIFPRTYSEFTVINNYTLFVTYIEQDATDNSKYYLYGCAYYLPSCKDNKAFFKSDSGPHNLNGYLYNDEELKFINYINILSFTGTESSTLTDGTTSSPTVNAIYKSDNLVYKYVPQQDKKSFEDIIIFQAATCDNPDYASYSEKCTLRIINCYESCEECDNVGNKEEHNCLVCNSDSNLNYHFVDSPSSKMCINGGEFYYLDTNDNYYKKCYESCQACLEKGTSTEHKCLSCYSQKRYFPITTQTTGIFNCYLDTLPPKDYYFDSENNRFEKCEIGCFRCNQEQKLKSQYFCKTCDTSQGYYALFEDDDSKKYAQCLQYPLQDNYENYILDEPAGRYRKCYASCASCTQGGNDEFNNCDSCKESLGVKPYTVNPTTCKCEYNFYYKIDPNDNSQSFTCTESLSCPSDYPYLLINSQNIRQCLQSCPQESPYIYNNQCFDHKLNGTIYDEETKQGSDNNTINTDSTQCIINDYITSTIPKDDIEKAKNDYVINYINEYSSNGGYDYTYNHANLIRNDNDEYMLLIFQNENCFKKIKDEYGLNFVDLTEYSKEIKNDNDIKESEPLTYAFLYSEPDDPKAEYQNLDYDCYNSYTGSKLNLSDTLQGKNITKNNPLPDGNKLKKLEYLSKYVDMGIDFSDPNSEFFNSQCFQFSSDKGKDVTLADRRKYFFNKIKICADECVFNGIDNETNTAKCVCPYDKGKAVINKNVKFPDYDEDYFIYDMWKCLKEDMVSPKQLKKSYITIIVFGLFIVAILFTLLYFLFLRNKFQFLSKIVSNNKNNNANDNTNRSLSMSKPMKSKTLKYQKISKNLVSNPPPKNEVEKSSESTTIKEKEKGYIQDTKRPFNYDSNNLFYHADENYTAGNQNLNSLFMGQNFKNNYSKEIAQFENDEKKPKEIIINNYNNITIPGKRLNKKNKAGTKRINNFNNINYSSNLFKINEEPPNQVKNSNVKNTLTFPKNEFSDGNSTEPIRSEDNKKKFKDPFDKTSIDIIQEKSEEEHIDETLRKAKGEIGEENMELNILEYITAKKNDKRSFCYFYFNQIKHRQIFLYTGYFHYLAEGLFMKILVVLFHILICLFFNLFWYRTSYVHDEFISSINNHATFSSKYAWFRILLSVACYIIVICLFHLIYLPQLKIYYSLINDKIELNEKKEIIKNKVKCMKINYIIFAVINLCFFIVLILYVLVFSYVFINSKTDLMISFVFTFIITQLLPFIFVFFVTCFRFIGLKCNSPCAYKFSLFFTI